MNYAQKVFEVGQESTIGVALWGMGAIADLSHRTLIALFADELRGYAPTSMAEIANRFVHAVWREYQSRLQQVLDRFRSLDANQNRTQEEMTEWLNLFENLRVGFCIADYLPFEREARAFEVAIGPDQNAAPAPSPLSPGTVYFWGCPSIIQRVLIGCDPAVVDAILHSGKWTGTAQELYDLVLRYRIAQPFDLPLREAIDWVNSVIYTTIKAMKFSHYLPVCGGPIEIAVISTDRLFRWVKHKRFDEALA